MGYDLSAVHYLQGMHTLTGVVAQYVFLVVEQDPPHGCAFVALGPRYCALADAKLRRAFDLWRRAIQFDKWPGYLNQIAFAEPTSWQMERALAEGDLEDIGGNTL